MAGHKLDDGVEQTVSVFGRRSLFLWCVGLVMIVGGMFVGPAWWGDELVLPLDDVYIHFQYARSIAEGTPYVYNDGLPPSSGATSLLYPYWMALGWLTGLRGLSLGWWALGTGLTALVGSAWLIGFIARLARLDVRDAVALVASFVLTGAVGWHYVSGMETGLLIFFMLVTLYGFLSERWGVAVVGAVLMAVTRPEGAIMAVVSSGVMGLSLGLRRDWRALFSVLPVTALGIQPMVNWLTTGSATAAGSSAKSILSRVPPDTGLMVEQISGNFGRMWWEFLTGYSVREGLYLPVGLLLLAIVGMVILVVRVRRPWVGLLVVGWLIGGTAAVSTLDPAFWHFKRYQMPFMALLFPLAAWALAAMGRRWRVLTLGVLVASSFISSTAFFAPAYWLNVGYLQQQQIPMARWLRQNTPSDAVVAVHDVGLMRYLGERTTVDMVGLTTAGAAASWRNGPGALAEFLSRYEPRPNYVASYTDALGLSYLADTGLYGDLLADFPVEPSGRFNVALAGAYQGVWRVDWEPFETTGEIGTEYYVDYVSGSRLVDEIDVAELEDESEHGYEWRNDVRLPGFPTEVHQFAYAGGGVLADGGRLINGEERFVVETVPGEDMVLVTRVHPQMRGSIRVRVDDTVVGTRSIPEIPGQWVDVATFIDGDLIAGSETVITIFSDVPDGHYMPYYHWLYQGVFPVEEVSEQPLAMYGEFSLEGVTLSRDDQSLEVALNWLKYDEQAPVDVRIFVHVYDDIGEPPLAQMDRYPLGGAVPPGNWLPGPVEDTILVDLTGLEAGTYSVAVGLYDPATGVRLQPTGTDETTADGRLLIGEIEVE